MAERKKAEQIGNLLAGGAMAQYRKEKAKRAVKPPSNRLPPVSEPPYDSDDEADFARKPTLLVAAPDRK